MCPHLCIAVKLKLFILFNRISMNVIIEFKMIHWSIQVMLIKLLIEKLYTCPDYTFDEWHVVHHTVHHSIFKIIILSNTKMLTKDTARFEQKYIKYKQKYIKYKQKYIEHKEPQNGGSFYACSAGNIFCKYLFPATECTNQDIRIQRIQEIYETLNQLANNESSTELLDSITTLINDHIEPSKSTAPVPLGIVDESDKCYHFPIHHSIKYHFVDSWAPYALIKLNFDPFPSEYCKTNARYGRIEVYSNTNLVIKFTMPTDQHGDLRAYPFSEIHFPAFVIKNTSITIDNVTYTSVAFGANAPGTSGPKRITRDGGIMNVPIRLSEAGLTIEIYEKDTHNSNCIWKWEGAGNNDNIGVPISKTL